MGIRTRILLAVLPAAVAMAQASPHDPLTRAAIAEIRAVRDAESIVLAHVVRVLPSPGVWCGIAVTRQEVVYAIDEVVAGAPRRGEVTIGHLLVAGSALVDDEQPFLRPDLFWPGARMLLCLQRDRNGGTTVADEHNGTRLLDGSKPGDRNQLELLRLVVALPDVAHHLHLEPPESRLLVRLDEVVPRPVPLAACNRPAQFAPPELLRGRRHLRVTRCEVGKDAASLAFEIVGEGASGTLTAARRDGDWAVVRSEVVER